MLSSLQEFHPGQHGSHENVWQATSGNLCDYERIDDYTVKLIFTDPYPFILKYLCHIHGTSMIHPMHYSSQFHHAYVEDVAALETQAKDAGLDSWKDLFCPESPPG